MGLKDLFAAHAADGAQQAPQHTINVSGMHCNACEKRVCLALEELGATDVVANHETGVVAYHGDVDSAAIGEAVTSLGFALA
ncbi:MAG: cation transporter [Atopobiaceae bacterium]|nr:cation transporter [Atopobiaceae bacterium]